jgi:putative ABC transport system ATP-binding protein
VSILAALLKPTSGQVLIDGLISPVWMIFSGSICARENWFYLSSQQYCTLSQCRKNVELMLRLNNKLDKAGKLRARELLALLGLGER